MLILLDEQNDCLPVRNALSRDGDGRLSVAGVLLVHLINPHRGHSPPVACYTVSFRNAFQGHVVEQQTGVPMGLAR
jgi:hypothetical protein